MKPIIMSHWYLVESDKVLTQNWLRQEKAILVQVTRKSRDGLQAWLDPGAQWSAIYVFLALLSFVGFYVRQLLSLWWSLADASSYLPG